MTVIDIVILFIVLISALFGIIRGFVKEAISLASWVIAIWVAVSFAPQVATMVFEGVVDSEAVRQALAFGLLLILTLIAGHVANLLFAQVVRKTGLSGADRIFGFGFGVLRGALVILVLVILGGMTKLPEAQWWQTSQLLPWFEDAALTVKDYIPKDINLSFQPKIEIKTEK